MSAIVIPQVIHRVWLGPRPMPDDFHRFGETWREHHPGWEMRLWTDDDLPDLQRPDALQRARHTAERANLVRYELLARFGGVYVDTDMECLRCIEPLLGGVKAFAGYQRPGQLNNAILGSVPGHPAFRRAVEEAEKRVGTDRSSVRATGPRFITEVLEGAAEVKLFDPEVFYPYDWTEKPRPASELPGAYAIHHWSRSGQEPSDPAARAEFLREQLALMRKRKHKAQRRADKAERAADRARDRVRRHERELETMRGSLWWRLRPWRLLAGGRRPRPRP